MAFCTNCGSEIGSGDVFCANCGTKVEAAVSPAPQETQTAASAPQPQPTPQAEPQPQPQPTPQAEPQPQPQPAPQPQPQPQPQAQTVYVQPTYPEGSKSKIAAGLFGILLGCWGVHNFYLGFTGRAVLQLVLTIVGLILSIVIVGVFLVLGIYIWALVEGILILAGSRTVDAKGIPLH